MTQETRKRTSGEQILRGLESLADAQRQQTNLLTTLLLQMTGGNMAAPVAIPQPIVHPVAQQPSGLINFNLGAKLAPPKVTPAKAPVKKEAQTEMVGDFETWYQAGRTNNRINGYGFALPNALWCALYCTPDVNMTRQISKGETSIERTVRWGSDNVLTVWDNGVVKASGKFPRSWAADHRSKKWVYPDAETALEYQAWVQANVVASA